MRRVLAGIILAVGIFLPSGARAAGAFGIQPSYAYQTAVSSITTIIITVSTSSATGATQVDSPTVTNRVALEIQNIDATANLWCLPVSTMPIVNGGRKIAAGASWVISTADVYYTTSYSTTTFLSSPVTSTAKFWCLSDGASATKAAVSQSY